MSVLGSGRYRLSSLAVFVFAGGCAAYAASLPLGSLVQPRAGMWPLVVSLVMAAAALSLLRSERDAVDYEPVTRRTWVVVAGFALMAVYVVLFSTIGFSLASLVVTLAWLRFMARERWAASIVIALALTAVAVGVFGVLLGVPVPADPVLDLLKGGGR